MVDTVTVASSAPMAIFVQQQPQDPTKLGELHAPKVAILNGSRHASAVNGVGITHDVDAELFHDFQQRNPQFEGILWEMSEEDEKKHGDQKQQFGFEPGLENADTEHQGEGGKIEGDVVTAHDMAATSTAPNDDSPRSQVPTPAPAVAAPPAGSGTLDAPHPTVDPARVAGGPVTPAAPPAGV